ncbi:MAG: hypothetical protein H6858_04880 [Rhodospirillales bacterium]|nr:hypothetical protein [Rhodospirillales bacterium]
MIYVQQKLGISERRACKALGQSRGLQRRVRKRKGDEEVLIGEMTALAVRYGRYGYKRITAMLMRAGRSITSASSACGGLRVSRFPSDIKREAVFI